MSRVIGVFSGKGGVGKTTLVANISSALTNVFNRKIVVFDSNLHSSHLGLHFGLYDDLPVTLREVLKRKVSIIQAVYICPKTGVRIIPAPLNGDGLNLTKTQCCSLLNSVSNNYDITILDCAPGLGREVLVPMQSVDEALVITTPDIASVTDAIKTTELLKKFKKNVLGIVLNRYSHQKYELTPEEIASTTGYKVLSSIPEDSNVPDAISKGLPVVVSHPHSKSSIGFKQLAASLINEHYREETMLERLKNIFNFRLPAFTKREIRPASDGQITRKEISDVVELKEDLTEEVKDELKREIMEKVRKRLKEKMHES